MPKYIIWEIYVLKTYFPYEYCLLCPSSWVLQDFKLGPIVIEKFKFSPDSLKNPEHQFLDRFYFRINYNVNWFLVTITDFNGLRKIFEKMYRKVKSIEIWPRYRAKSVSHNFHFPDSPSQPHFHYYLWSVQPRTTQSTFPKALMLSNVHWP